MTVQLKKTIERTGLLYQNSAIRFTESDPAKHSLLKDAKRMAIYVPEDLLKNGTSYQMVSPILPESSIK